MSDKEKLKFDKTISTLEDENPQQNDDYIRRQKTKEILIKQFNLSDAEAEEKLMELEGKSWARASITAHKVDENKSYKPKKLTLKTPENYSNEETIVPQHVLDRENKLKQTQKSKPIEDKTPEPIKEEKDTEHKPEEEKLPKPTKSEKVEETPQEEPVEKDSAPKLEEEKPSEPAKDEEDSESVKTKIIEFLKDDNKDKSKLEEEIQEPTKSEKVEETTEEEPSVEKEEETPQEKPAEKDTEPKPEEEHTAEEHSEEDSKSVENKFLEFLKDDDADEPKPEEENPQEPAKDKKEIESEEDLNAPSIEENTNKRKFSISNLFNKDKKDDTPEPETAKLEPGEQDIDAILGEIVPNYSQDVSIELQNVNLSFEVRKDQIDNLKEQVIRTLKRNKSQTEILHVLKDISFKIYQGDKVGIIGYNGAGKSTLLKLIVGIYKPDTGCVKTNGKISPLLTLGAGFDNNFSGAKNIYLNGAILGYDKKFIEERYDEIVEFSELGESIDYPIRNYSSGMKAKLGFSIATLVNPDILIIDEILGVGDVNFRRKSRDKMRSLMGGKTTVLLVSHSIGQIREICDKAIWIDDGRVREIGEVNQVCDNYMKDSKKATKEQLKDIQFN